MESQACFRYPRTRRVQRGAGAVEGGKLPFVAFAASKREMGEHALQPHQRVLCQRGQRVHVRGIKAQPMQAGFDLPVHARHLPGALGRGGDGRGAVFGESRQQDAAANGALGFRRARKAEHQHVRVRNLVQNLLGLAHAGHGKGLCALGAQKLRDLPRAHAVGVRLQNADQLAFRRQHAARRAVVFKQRVHIDFRPAAAYGFFVLHESISLYSFCSFWLA